MKLAISALFLSLALSATLAAQTATNPGSDAPPPPLPGMHPGGPHGPHGPGMFGPGRAAHRVETVSNSPFTAQFTETANYTDHQGTQQQRTSTSTVYRDSQGRVREEITLPPPPPRTPSATQSGAAAAPAAPRGPRTLVTILDPVAHTITHLNAERQTAYVQTVPADFFTRMQQREDRRASGEAQHTRDNATVTSLGSRLFSGVSATGEQTVLNLPVRDGESAHTMTHQSWFSPDLKFEVSSTETSDRGTHSDTLTSLNKAEPNPNLFQVPAGYTTSSVPQRDFPGHRRGGTRGTEDGVDAPPPPPPTM